MRMHGNAALSLNGRRRMVLRVVERDWSIAQAAMAAEVSERTCSKWVGRYRAQGEPGLVDRSSAPRLVANRTEEHTIHAIAALRRLRFTGPEIAEVLGRPLSTVSGILTRIGMGKLSRLGLEPAVRYERARPGELIHIDVKKLGRIHGGAGKRITGGIKRNPRRTRVDTAGIERNIIGWDYVHIAIDDATRLAYAEILGDERAMTAVGFLKRALAFFARHGIPRRARDHRQRLRLPLDHARHRLSRPRPAPPAHPPLPPADQRQSRAVHPNPAGRLGLRRALPQQLRTHRSP